MLPNHSWIRVLDGQPSSGWNLSEGFSVLKS
jgi:hypothetical protein